MSIARAPVADRDCALLLQLVISGGQTGADQGGLEGAKAAGVRTGGLMPKGFLTEYGERPEFADLYGCTVHRSRSYGARTRINVETSDGTVVFGDATTGGSLNTVKHCRELGKPWLVIPMGLSAEAQTAAAECLAEWVQSHGIRTLNVAGNRESKMPGLQRFVGAVVEAVLLVLRDRAA